MPRTFDIITPVIADDVPYLEEAISSVAEQEVPTHHYIIGPKTDKIEEYCSPAYVTFYEREGLSVSEARNVGINKSNASIISFLDADDRYTPQHLQLVDDALSTADVCWSNMVLDGGSNNIKELPEPAPPAEFYSKFLAIPLSALALRRSVLGDIRFQPQLELGEGIDFVTRLLSKGIPSKIKQPSVIKGVRSDSLSVSMNIGSRISNQIQTAIFIANAVPSCRTRLPIVLTKIQYRVIRDLILN